ncbi:MAG: hypothetical protein QW751_02580 [Candidatus Aenigmatarchaeota archaeon]|nr:hypothetical protein [Candidatus Aenigmarchaeota archaeon]
MQNKLAIAIFLSFLLIMPLAAAKNVVFITGDDTCHRGTCSCLSSEPQAFCNRLKTTLGYNVTIIGESYVIANDSLEWQPWVNNADLIFLGDTSTRTANTSSSDRNRFCGNISLVTSNRKVFATFINVQNFPTEGLVGCAFSTQLAMVEWPQATNNTCMATVTPSNFRKLKDGYVTSGMPSEPVLYTDPYYVSMHGPPSPSTPVGWIGLACPNPTGVFSVVNTSAKGAFWGLLTPSVFTSDAWALFDRTVWDILGETGWTVMPYVIPSIATANQSVLLVAKVTERGQPISSGNVVNFTLNGINGTLFYDNGYWLNSSTAVPYIGSYNLNVKGWDAYMLRGSGNKSFSAGNMTVTIISGDYVQGENYTIVANVSYGTVFQPANVYFSIWNTSDWTKIIDNQPMSRSDSYYTAAILGTETSQWRGTLLLEVTAFNTSLPEFYKGGNYKYIMAASALVANLTTDKAAYKPGEIVNLSLLTAYPPNVTGVNISIIDPSGTNASLGTMVRFNNTLWTLSYTLPPGSLNGTHVFNVSFTDGSRTNWTAHSIDVKAYDVYFSKNKAIYMTGDTVGVTLQIINPYTSNINFSVAVNVTDPANNTTNIGNGTISGSGSWNTSWTIPATAVAGTYMLTAFISDSVNPDRRTNVSDSFFINTTAYVSVSPLKWSLNATSAKRYTQTFILNNTGALDISNLTITPSAAIAPFVVIDPEKIDSLPRGNIANFTASWNATLPVNLTGTLVVAADRHPMLVSIPVALSMSPLAGQTPIQKWLSVNPTSLINTTIPDKSWNAEFMLSNTGGDEISEININVSEELRGIITVIDKPDALPASGSELLLLNVNTTDASIGSYMGTVTIDSTGGSAEISVKIKVIGNVPTDADALSAELDTLSASITAFAAKGKNVSAVINLASAAASDIAAARDAWEAEDYETADAKMEDARGKIESIRAQLAALSAAPVQPKSAGGVIWAVAFVVVLLIAGITVFKFKEQIRGFIENLLKRKPKAPAAPREEYPSEERETPPEEEAPPEEQESRYRTEWY